MTEFIRLTQHKPIEEASVTTAEIVLQYDKSVFAHAGCFERPMQNNLCYIVDLMQESGCFHFEVFLSDRWESAQLGVSLSHVLCQSYDVLMAYWNNSVSEFRLDLIWVFHEMTFRRSRFGYLEYDVPSNSTASEPNIRQIGYRDFYEMFRNLAKSVKMVGDFFDPSATDTLFFKNWYQLMTLPSKKNYLWGVVVEWNG